MKLQLEQSQVQLMEDCFVVPPIIDAKIRIAPVEWWHEIYNLFEHRLAD